jgi:hypothetical protein
MAKKKGKPQRRPQPPPAVRTDSPAERPGVTRERFRRLYKMVRSLGEGGKTRDTLTEQLALDVRGFYRDLEVLETFGVEVTLSGGVYTLTASEEDSIARLPFPDPHLTLGEIRHLAKGRAAVHRRMLEGIEELLR